MLLFVAIGALLLVGFFWHIGRAGAGRHGAAAVGQDVPEPSGQPGPGDAEHPVAGSAGPFVRGFGLPPDGSRLQRHRDRS